MHSNVKNCEDYDDCTDGDGVDDSEKGQTNKQISQIKYSHVAHMWH